MNFRTVNHERLGEIVHEYDHPSGLKVFHIEKKGFNKKTALFATHYGSIDNVIKAADQSFKVPDGIAHFLEHKLFEQEDGNMLDKFSKLGASPNAYTSFSQTVYYFSCTERFEDNFKMLLNYVQKPWLTDENVEKEKGIIGQEIRMYQDNADWRVFFNLLDCLYVNHPVKLDITGSLESIAQINKELLYQCYNAFYTPSNMVVIAAGDMDPNAVFTEVDRMIQFGGRNPVEKSYPEEPKELHQTYKEQKLHVSMPLFSMGIKDTERVSGEALLKRRTALGIILASIMGKSSELFNTLYDQGLINDSFRFEASLDQSYGFVACSGQSSDPEKVAGIIQEAIARHVETGLEEETFNRIRKSHEGLYVRSLNSSDNIAREMMDSYFNGTSYMTLGDVYATLDRDYANTVLKNVFSQPAALSVVKPV